jgi:hypothetical protein
MPELHQGSWPHPVPSGRGTAGANLNPLVAELGQQNAYRPYRIYRLAGISVNLGEAEAAQVASCLSLLRLTSRRFVFLVYRSYIFSPDKAITWMVFGMAGSGDTA